jgi:transposase
VAAIAVGLTGDVRRFPDKDHFAAYNGSAPIEVYSASKRIYRLSMRGSRQLNHALHMASVTQVRHRHCKAVPTTTARSPKARPAKEPYGRSNAASATLCLPRWSPTPIVTARKNTARVAREGKRGTAQ